MIEQKFQSLDFAQIFFSKFLQLPNLEENEGEMPDYSVIQSLPYLESVVLETLRMHTPLGTIVRACTKASRDLLHQHAWVGYSLVWPKVRRNDRVV